MNFKEWMKLIIPIVSNGIILWGIQLIIMHKIEQKNSSDQIKNEVYRKNLSLIEKGLRSCRELTSAMVNQDDDNDITLGAINNAINQLRDDIRNLYFFYDDYHIIIDEDIECKKMYTELNDRFVEAVTHWDDTKTVIAFLRNCEKLLHNIMNSTLKHIYMVD